MDDVFSNWVVSISNKAEAVEAVKPVLEVDVEVEFVKLLEMVENNEAKPLSSDFYERIEALKAKAGGN